ncbi:prephenate dehydrogenase/arogenate dehydrogenase family protein [Sinorhizobium meliloti]|uniref:prephenate dehydrogenase/arogenate dehydrogenase family protein n=1 Tax=Rhizobium meliloti TaxID=382 RepID=UPI0012FD910A|nr:prephenate dehydrogenase/arogenate dehydrogenase family protein [Sinorhizobium meliloti]MDE3857068.1 prephenate dehydrogenase/arogenate dehydrogenase family protein [Sinorhizobium meliloti]
MSSSFRQSVILGSEGAMGRWLGKVLAKNAIPFTGVDIKSGTNTFVADVLNAENDLHRLLEGADLIILAVPEDVAIKCVAQLSPHINSFALLVDCCSTKRDYVEAVSVTCVQQVLSLNPLFGPGVETSDRTLVTTTIKPGALTKKLVEILSGEVASVIELGASQHDEYMAMFQAGAHALILAFVTSIPDVRSALFPLPTAVLARLAARLLSLPAHVYWEIQAANPFAREARKKLIQTLVDLDSVVACKDRAAFDALFANGNRKLGSEAAPFAADCLELFATFNRGRQ